MSRAKLSEIGSQVIDLGTGRVVKLLDIVGRGAAATVYRGLLCSAPHGISKSIGIERAVAVKVMSAVASDEAESVHAELVRVSRRVACVDHPNVVRVYECGAWRSRPFVVEELVPGIALSALVTTYTTAKRRIPPDVALFIASEIAEGLAGARNARDHDGIPLGIVHRGLSARDVLLSWRGEVKVTDFGMSAAQAASSAVRSIRGVTGRVVAMAPEVAQGAAADARSDVFSLGVILRELFVGPRFPVGIGSSDAVRLAREGYIHPLTFGPRLPEGLLQVMTRALEIDPDKRYPNACVMATDLCREAFAMGVGDGRYFLRRTLERDFTQHADEITADRKAAASDRPSIASSDRPSSDREPPRTSGVAPRDGASTESYGAELVSMKRRT